jgi:ectoine hydroxylase-related dioxygenase (phytanoyl-CoA dioxygenase family)
MTVEINLQQLEDEGYTVVKNFLDPVVTAALRDRMDFLIGPIAPEDQKPENGIRVLRHPIPGQMMGPLAANPRLIEAAQTILRVDNPSDLRLLEQVFIRSDPVNPPYEVNGWHIDMAFNKSEYERTPRYTYYHMVHCCNTVPPGGGAFTIVPGSHKLTYKATENLHTSAELKEFQKDVIKRAGIDVSKMKPVLAEDGDLLIFNPMALHSASRNSTNVSRYVYFASFRHKDSDFLNAELKVSPTKPNYHPDFAKWFPPHLKDLIQQP